jgi:ketosteroid isomerase-like protein
MIMNITGRGSRYISMLPDCMGAAILCGLFAAISLPVNGQAVTEKQPDLSGITARLQQLEDVEAIRQLLNAYGRTLDARDFRAYAELFAENGVWIGGFGSVQGRAAIQAEMEKQIGTGLQRPGSSNHHIFMNESIEVYGDTATALSKWLFLITGEGNRPVPVYLGHYADQLVKVQGVWKFKRRVVYADIPFQDPLANE